MIPLAVGANRVVRGIRVEHVCGNPELSAELDHTLSRRIVEEAMDALESTVEGPTEFFPLEATGRKEPIIVA